MTIPEEIQRRIYSKEIAESLGLNQLPQTAEEAARVEDLLEKELGKLSVDDNERALLAIHGIDTLSEDRVRSADAITKAIHELRLELRQIPQQQKVAYERAMEIDSSYVNNEAFQLMFLRAEKFNAKNAAAVMVHHFHVKNQIFVQRCLDERNRNSSSSTAQEENDEILVRDIFWSDLDASDQDCAKSGFFQVSRSKDAAGRTVMIVLPPRFSSIPAIKVARCFWYMAMCMLRDEETQEKGVVRLVFNFTNHVESLDFMKNARLVQEALPIPSVSAHYCFNSPTLRPLLATLCLLLQKDTDRNRFRPHFGNPKDVAFELQTVGIQVEDTPLLETAESQRRHVEWLEMLAIQESKQKVATTCSEDAESPSITIIPRQFDVLFGKTKKAYQHMGNIRCQHLIEIHSEEYEAANRRQKTKVSDRILALIHESKGRFLKWDGGVWIEVDDKMARDKISHYFRAQRNVNKSFGSPALASKSEKKRASAAFSSDSEKSTHEAPSRASPMLSLPDSFLSFFELQERARSRMRQDR